MTVLEYKKTHSRKTEMHGEETIVVQLDFIPTKKIKKLNLIQFSFL